MLPDRLIATILDYSQFPEIEILEQLYPQPVRTWLFRRYFPTFFQTPTDYNFTKICQQSVIYRQLIQEHADINSICDRCGLLQVESYTYPLLNCHRCQKKFGCAYCQPDEYQVGGCYRAVGPNYIDFSHYSCPDCRRPQGRV